MPFNRNDGDLSATAAATPTSLRSGQAGHFFNRRFLFAPIAAAHLAAFAAFHAGYPGVADKGSGGIAVFDVTQPATTPVRTEVSFDLDPIEVTDLEAPAIEFAPDIETVPSSEAAAAGASCDLTALVQQTLRSDATVRVALASLPRADRSVANAVMLWDGRWVDGASAASSVALADIRKAISAVVLAAPAWCRSEAQTGPRLFAIAGPPDTMLALGSGRWRWADLASP